MARDVAVQHLRGPRASIPSLDDGEFYFTTDTAELFVGYAGLNFNLGVRGMANVIVQGSANPSHFIEPNLDGSINIVAGSPLSVTGNFFQATQPVSIAATISVDGSAHVQPVSGTFFQATQPVSGTITANAGSGTFITDDLAASVVGSAPPANAMYVGANKAGVLTGLLLDANGNLSVNISDVGGNAAVAKGVQPALAIPTQDMKDSGRVIKVFSGTYTGATTEALITLTPVSDGVAGSTGTSFTVTAGKRLRLTALMVTTRNAAAAGQGTVVNLRMTSTGAVIATSPLIVTQGAGTGLAIANIVGSNGAGALPDGIELSGTMQFGLSQVGTATAGNTVTLIGFEY